KHNSKKEVTTMTQPITQPIDYQNTFKRYEKKYSLDFKTYQKLRTALLPYMDEDPRGEYSISNLYYDTTSYELIRHSLEKPIYKEKMRLRSYGTPGKDDLIFLELKKKYKKEVYKRRIALTLDEYQAFVHDNTLPNKDNQILSEMCYFIKKYDPYPRAFIGYDRFPLMGKDDPSFRITFDKNIRFRGDNLCLTKGDYGQRLLPEGQYLMEIKVPGVIPIWLCHILTELSIYSQSFSKYGYSYSKYIQSKIS
ncbi:MAG: polyphosphate polymerase domain-containing protein, partial [Acetobacterium sp.]